MRLYLSSESQRPLASSRQKGLIAVDSPGSRMIRVNGTSRFSSVYSGELGRCFSSIAILVRSAVSMILAGVRPRFVAMMVKLFSALGDGSTEIRIQDLSAWRIA